MWAGIDKRRFPRAFYKCQIIVRKKESSQRILTHTENIGGGGVCVILDDELALFQAVEIEIVLDDGEGPLRCGGTVVWVVKKRPVARENKHTYDTGIEFVDMKEDDRQRVLRTVEEILKKEKPQA